MALPWTTYWDIWFQKYCDLESRVRDYSGPSKNWYHL